MIDLHIHTEHSMDGDKSVGYIMEECVKKGIKTAAFADHNSTAAIAAGIEAAGDHGMEIIPAIEIDTVFAGSVFHLLGYFIEYESDDFTRLEAAAEKAELDAFPEVVDRIAALGIEISMELAMQEAAGGRLTEEIVARTAVTNPANRENSLIRPFLEGGERSGMPVFNFFHDYMAPGKAAFVLKDYIAFEDAVSLVRETGGVPVLAHPGQNLKGRDGLLSDMRVCGLRGIEAYSSYHDASTCLKYRSLAEEHGLLVTCGSDFHGSLKPKISLGGHGCESGTGLIIDRLREEAGKQR